MKCAFCDGPIGEGEVRCPYCQSVLQLECPSCFELTSVFGDRCSRCGHPRENPPSKPGVRPGEAGPEPHRQMSMTSLLFFLSGFVVFVTLMIVLGPKALPVGLALVILLGVCVWLAGKSSR